MKKTESNAQPLSESEILLDMKLQAVSHCLRFNKSAVTATRRVKLGFLKVEKVLTVTHEAK